MKKISRLPPLVIALIMTSVLSAQGVLERDLVPLKNWDAPMYWQPSVVESKDAAVRQILAGNSRAYTASDITPAAQTPANSLVFVGMTPCRVVDTRPGSGFTGAFGPPILVGGVSRTFPIQLSPQCSIPSVAQAYSFNVTVVPPGFLDFITVWPTGQAQPNASTLNSYIGTVIANAAIVPAGTSGSVDVYASQNTHLIIDINGYYAPQTGMTLTQGTVGAPSLSFAGDPGTGIFSSGAGTLDIATGGMSRLSLRPDGDLDLAGSIRKNGSLWLHSLGMGNTGVGLGTLSVNTGSDNTAIGLDALGRNMTGTQNTAMGQAALSRNTTGNGNTAIGRETLPLNDTGSYNTAAGISALLLNETGSENTASGYAALLSNRSGLKNTAAGSFALYYNTIGHFNTASGMGAGVTNTSANANKTGSNNTFIGYFAGPGTSTQHSNATAIGANAIVSASNSLVLGSIENMNGATASTSVGIGLTVPKSRLDVVDSAAQIRFGDSNLDDGGYLISTSASQAILSGGAKWNGSAWVAKSTAASFIDNDAGGILFFTNNGLTPGSTFSPTERMSIVGGVVSINTLGSGGSTSLCRNASNQISTCSSSLRYKRDVHDFDSGLDLVRRLRPVSFNWKEDGMLDFGLVAEDVATVEPLLVTRNEEGQIEGVKYDRIGVVLVNAVQEQQRQIETQQSQITAQQKHLVERDEQLERQQREIDGLKQILCFDHPEAAVCK